MIRICTLEEGDIIAASIDPAQSTNDDVPLEVWKVLRIRSPHELNGNRFFDLDHPDRFKWHLEAECLTNSSLSMDVKVDGRDYVYDLAPRVADLILFPRL